MTEVLTPVRPSAAPLGAVSPTPAAESPEAMLAALAASIAAAPPSARIPRPVPGELKYRLTSYLFPSVLLIFVALYVTSLASGVAPESALFRAGGVGVILALLARFAIGIVGDENNTLAIEQELLRRARASVESRPDSIAGRSSAPSGETAPAVSPRETGDHLARKE
ncbi:MAG: hypothetical protein IT305_20090 [Chloroflexi bacterium]|nr:hypothetical protein [Chloroflexota bacterium]